MTQEKIKVHGTKEGKLYIHVYDLFSLKRIQELIKKVSERNITRRSQV